MMTIILNIVFRTEVLYAVPRRAISKVEWRRTVFAGGNTYKLNDKGVTIIRIVENRNPTPRNFRRSQNTHQLIRNLEYGNSVDAVFE